LIQGLPSGTRCRCRQGSNIQRLPDRRVHSDVVKAHWQVCAPGCNCQRKRGARIAARAANVRRIVYLSPASAGIGVCCRGNGTGSGVTRPRSSWYCGSLAGHPAPTLGIGKSSPVEPHVTPNIDAITPSMRAWSRRQGNLLAVRYRTTRVCSAAPMEPQMLG
jgi:hypothetical protein